MGGSISTLRIYNLYGLSMPDFVQPILIIVNISSQGEVSLLEALGGIHQLSPGGATDKWGVVELGPPLIGGVIESRDPSDRGVIESTPALIRGVIESYHRMRAPPVGGS